MKLTDILNNEKFLIAAILVAAAGVGLGAGLYKYYPEKLGLAAKPGNSSTTASSASSSPSLSAKEKANMDEMKALEKHLENKPEHPPILFRMAQLNRESGKLGEAAKLLKEILKQEPDNVDAHLELGRVLYETGDVAGAIDQTKLILKKNPKHADALYNLGAIYANTNNIALAREYWTKAAASDPASESGKNAERGLQQLAGQESPVAPAAVAAQRPASFDSSLRLPKPEDFR